MYKVLVLRLPTTYIDNVEGWTGHQRHFFLRLNHKMSTNAFFNGSIGNNILLSAKPTAEPRRFRLVASTRPRYECATLYPFFYRCRYIYDYVLLARRLIRTYILLIRKCYRFQDRVGKSRMIEPSLGLQ